MGQLEPGDVIDGKYRILRLLGEGGMGSVYEGENVKIHRKVAIKTLLAAVAGNADVIGRFEREATAAGRIGNPHILEVLDLGEMKDGDRYLVMELLDGEPLSNRIERQGRLSPAELAPLAVQVLEGLGAAHAAGIIHRDLKPDNIFLLKNHVGIKDYVKIIDFGISKFQPLSGDSEGMSMTRTGAVMGTPYYMSPEQASGSRDADLRTDLYALGVILYQAVTGQVPFDAPTFNQLLFKIVLSEPPPVQSVVPEIDEAFASIIARSMARDINARFQTSKEFADALAGWLSSGAAVSVPPPPDRAAMEASATGIPVSRGPHKPNATAGSWSTSQAGLAAPPPSRKPVIIGLSLAGALLAAGIAFVGVRAMKAEAVPASAAAPVVAPAPPAVPAPPPVAVLAEKKAEPEPEVTPSPEAVAVVEPRAVAPEVKATPKKTAAQKAGPAAKSASPKPAAKKKTDDDDFGY